MRAGVHIFIVHYMNLFIFVSDFLHCFLRLLVTFYCHFSPPVQFFQYLFLLCCYSQMYYNSVCSTSLASICFACCYCRITRHLSIPHHQNLYCFWQCSLAWISLHCVPEKISSFRRTTRTFCSYSLSLPLSYHHCTGLRYGQMLALPERDTLGLWVVLSTIFRL